MPSKRSGQRADPVIATMVQANAPLLMMDSNPDPGFIIGRFRGHAMPPGRGLLISSSESARYTQVAIPSGGQN